MRSFPIVSIALGLLLLTSGVVRADEKADAKAILEKALKAHGGAEKVNKAQAGQAKTKGTIELLGGLTFTEESFTQPGKLKTVVQLEVMGQTVEIITVFNGEKGWVKVGGNTKELEGKELNELKDATYLMSLSRFNYLNDKNYELTTVGEIKVNDKAAVGVKIAHKGKPDVNLYFDKQSGLLTKLERQGVDPMTEKEFSEERIITEYQELDGVKTPKKALIKRDGKKFIEVEVLEAKTREKLDDSEFAKP